MALTNNPLKQYFRRPAIYLKLPSGGLNYPAGIIDMPANGELPVYPMTAIDDITVKTPDALFNGMAVVEIIKSCVPCIKDPWKITSVDLDAILIAVRAAANGNEMEIETTCPKCEETSKYGVNLVGLLTTMKAGDYETEFPLNGLLIKFKPLIFKEMTDASIGQFELQRLFNQITAIENEEERATRSKQALLSVTNTTMRVLANTIEYIKTPEAFVVEPEFILDFIQSCDKNMFDAIKDHNAALRAQTEVKPLDIKCVACGHEYKQAFSLNVADFFD